MPNILLDQKQNIEIINLNYPQIFRLQAKTNKPLGLIIIMSVCLAIYGVVSFEDSEITDQLQSSKGWKKFTSGWLVGAIGGSSFAFMLLNNVPMF